MTTTQINALAKVINVDDLMSRCLGNMDFVKRILSIFQSRCEADLLELEEAIQSLDLQRVQRISHRLKGACANAGANSLSARAGEMWTAANQERADLLTARFSLFRDEWSECAAILAGEGSPEDVRALATTP